MNFINDNTFRKTLTNYTVGNYNDVEAFTAPFLAPFTQVPTPVGFYQKYDSLAGFAYQDAQRQPGQSAVVVTWGGKPQAYNITPRALDTVIDQALLEYTDAESAMIHYESIAKMLVSSAHTSLEKDTWDFASGSLAITTGYGNGWSTASGSTVTVNPLAEIEDLYFQIARDIGVAPNRIIFGANAFRWLKTATTTRGTWPQGMTDTKALNQYLKDGLPIGNGLQCKISFTGYSSNPGQSTRTITGFTSANEIWLFYASDSPDRNDRSAFKNLQFGTGITNMRTYMSPDQRSTFLALDWYVQPIYSNGYAVKRILCT